MRRPAIQAKPAPTTTATPVMGLPRLPVWLIGVLLVLGTMAIYWPATRCDFVNTDDDVNVTANVQVQKGLTLESIKWAFLNPVATLWQPLTVCSHMVDCQVFGLNPWGHHLSSVLLHAANTGLVFLFLLGLTGALWRSLLVAALFAVHPLRVEAVAWVTERREVLCVFFGLLALIAYACYTEGRRQKSEDARQETEDRRPWSVVRGLFCLSHLPSSIFYFLSFFFLALGLMSKPTLVTWPFVMLLLDYWPLRRNAECGMRNAEPGAGATGQGRTLPWRKLVWEKAPFFFLVALMSVVTFVVQKRAGALAAGESLTLSARLGNALISYCRYLGKMFWPTELALGYPHPGQWPLGRVVLAGGVILGVSVLLWVRRQRYPYLLMGWLWYCGTLVPVSQVIQTANEAMADRWTYLPSLGVLILTVWGAYELTCRWRYQVLGLSVAGGAAIVLCLALTRHQLGYWRDSEALSRHTLEVTENNDIAHNQLGAALAKKGQMDEALRHFQEAIRLNPHYSAAHNNLGLARGMKGQMDEALRQFQEAARLKPDHADAHNNLGAALIDKGQIDEAIHQYQEAIRLEPDYAEAHNNLGLALGKKGQIDEAMGQFQKAVRLKPDYADAHHNLGAALGMKGQTDEAIRQFQETVRLKPDYADAHHNLGVALAKKGQIDEAIRQFQEALSLKPDYGNARRNLDVLLDTKAHSSKPPGASTNR
jgi:tetratricopeptide (TPR) repeat protein